MLVQARGSFWLAVILPLMLPSLAAAEPEVEFKPAGFSIIGPDNPAARCAVDQERQAPARRKARRGVLGWLYRYTRNVDVERGNMPVPLYLRSPLLTAVPLPDCDTVASDEKVEQCAVVVIDRMKDDGFDATVSLPQLDADSPARLAQAIRHRLGEGESVMLRTTTGSAISIDPQLTRRIETRNCVIDA